MAYGNILLISDRTPIFPDLARLLAQAGYRVTLTFFGREAFQALRSGKFPLVISRISKDWSDNRPFMEVVREANREISLLLLRVDPDFAFPVRAYLIKTDGYQFEPQGWGGLRHLVTECLRENRQYAGSTHRQLPAGSYQKNKHTESKGSLLEFRRKDHAPRQHSINQ